MGKPGKTKKTKKRKKIRLPDVLSQKELDALLNAPSRKSAQGIRARCILALMGKCGLRVSEVCNLQTTDIRLGADDPYVRVIGKGNKERRGFLGGGLVDLLAAWIKVRPKPGRGRALFPVMKPGRRGLGISKPGRAITRQTVGRMVKGFAEKAQIDRPIHPHTLRHTAATLALRSGANLRKVQKMLGHAGIGTTEVYVHVTDDELAGMARRMDPGGGVERVQKLKDQIADLMKQVQEFEGNGKGE